MQVEEVRRERATLEHAFLDLMAEDESPGRARAMMHDVWTVVLEGVAGVSSISCFRFRRGGWSVLLIDPLARRYLRPLQTGPSWLTSPLPPVYWPLLTSSMVSTLIADAVAGERERHTLESASRQPALRYARFWSGSFLRGCCTAYSFTVASDPVGYVVISLRTCRIPASGGFPLQRFRAVLLLVVLACSALAGVGVFVSLRAATVRQAQQTLGIIMMVCLMAPFLFLQFIDRRTPRPGVGAL